MQKELVLFIGNGLEKLIPFASNLKAEGFRSHFASNAKESLEFIKNELPAFVFCNFRMPHGNGLKLKEQVRGINPYINTTLLCNGSDNSSLMRKLSQEGHVYLCSPYRIQDIFGILKKDSLWQPQKTLELESHRLQKKYEYFGLIGRSEAMLNVLRQIESISQNDGTVLIIGERGTGKELVAKAIHLNSSRKTGPFVEVSCSAIPESCLDRELYGNSGVIDIKGGVPGNGYFSMAKGGSIFLDEIEKTSLESQAKLLHYLQGNWEANNQTSKGLPLSFRILATSNSSLEEQVHSGKFRYDLFYRINILTIFLPPLRDRQKDIPLLLDYYLSKYSPPKRKFIIDPKAMELLINHSWPGNVRQLENIVERLVLTVSGNIIFDHHLPNDFRIQGDSYLDIGNNYNFDKAISEVEKSIIIKALTLTRGNKKLAAKKLKIPYSTFRNKLIKLRIHKEDYQPKHHWH